MFITACRRSGTRSTHLLAVCILAAAAAIAAAASAQDAPRTECSSADAVRFDFFPDNARNIPEGWTLHNQRRAGNMCNGQLLPIALYGSPKPLLHFRPLHELLAVGAQVDMQQWDRQAGANITSGTGEQEQVFTIASLPDAADAAASGFESQYGAAELEPQQPRPLFDLLPGSSKPPQLSPPLFGSAKKASKQQAPPLFGGSKKAKPLAAPPLFGKRGEQQPPQLFGSKKGGKPPPLFGSSSRPQLPQEARDKALQTFIQVLLTGVSPDEIEVAARDGSAGASSGAGGAGRPTFLREAVVDRGNGDVQRYVNRVLLGQDAESASSSSSSGASGVLRERGSINDNLQAFGAFPGSSSSSQEATPPQAATSIISPKQPSLLGGLLPQLPWSKDNSARGGGGSGGLFADKKAVVGLAHDLSTGQGLAAAGGALSSSSNISNTWTVTQPASFVYSVEVNGRHWFASQVHAHNSSMPRIDFQGNVTAHRRDLFDPVIFAEGVNTMLINVTILQNTGLFSNGPHSRVGPSVNHTFSSPPIDFYFFMWGNATHDSRPSAVVEFDSCRPEAAIKFSKSRPTPVLLDGYRLTYKPVQGRTNAFFLPVFHVYGQFVKGLDGSTDLRTDNTEGNIKNFGLYLTRLPGSPSNFTFAGPELDGLKEGWWQFTVEGSLWVPLPHLAHLLSLSGIDRYGNTDAMYREVQPDGRITDGMSLLNSVKGAGWVIPDYTNMRVGLQKAMTVLDYFEGPSAPLVLGDKAVFNWHWTGLDSGNTHCAIDGAGTVSLAGNCSTPLTYTVRTNLNQTLTVTYKDVCGKSFNASMTFGPSFGWHVDVQELAASDLLSIGSNGNPTLMQQRNSAAGSSPGAAMAWTRALGAAAATLWLTAVLTHHMA